MKKLLLIILFAPLLSKAQDTTILTLSCKARLVQTFAKFAKNNDDTAYSNLRNRWIKKFDPSLGTPPSGTTQVSVDSIKVTVIADLYDFAFSFPQGVAAVGSDFASDILTIRGNSTYLDRLCDAIDLRYSNFVPDLRTRGRIILTGKSN